MDGEELMTMPALLLVDWQLFKLTGKSGEVAAPVT